MISRLGGSETHTKPTPIVVIVEEKLVREVDRLVKDGFFENRSCLFRQAVQEKLERIRHNRLARECAKLRPSVEENMAEEGLANDLHLWPKY